MYRRHDISFVLMYDLNRRWTFTGAWIYGSGDVTWLPTGRTGFSDVAGVGSYPIIPVYEDRNNFRVPSYHRLDIGVIYHMFPRWGESNITLSIYNAYDRRNPYFLYLDSDTEVVDLGGTEGENCYRYYC